MPPPEHPPRWSEYMDLKSLRPDPRNPKAHDIDLLRASLGRWGYVEPVVVDERTGLLVAGHGRRELLLADLASGAAPPEGVVAEGGRWTLPVQRGWSSVDDDEAGAYLVASNQIGVVGGWDTVALADLLAGVAEGPGLDGVGFDTDDLAAMLAEIAPPPVALRDPDDVPEPPAEPVTRLGDVWVMGPHRLICGDSFDASVVESVMGGKRADMVWTDPPYGLRIVRLGAVGGSKPYGSAPDVNDATGADRARCIVDVRQYRPVIGDNSVDTAVAAYQLVATLAPRSVVFWGGNHYASALPDSSCWLVWDKLDGMNGNNFADCELAWTNHDGAVRMFQHRWSGMLRASERGPRVHPTQKPVALAVWGFERLGKPTDIVLDLFAGSGSTLIACEQTGRAGRMVELDPLYCDVICRRFEEFSGIVPVLESTGEEHSFRQSGEGDVAAFLAESDSPVS